MGNYVIGITFISMFMPGCLFKGFSSQDHWHDPFLSSVWAVSTEVNKTYNFIISWNALFLLSITAGGAGGTDETALTKTLMSCLWCQWDIDGDAHPHTCTIFHWTWHPAKPRTGMTIVLSSLQKSCAVSAIWLMMYFFLILDALIFSMLFNDTHSTMYSLMDTYWSITILVFGFRDLIPDGSLTWSILV